MNERKVSVITGGAQGIGRVTAEHFLAEGFQVAVWDIDEEALAEEGKKYIVSANWLGCLCDVASEISVNQAFVQTLSEFGRIDVLVNNAAIAVNKSMHDLTVDEFSRVLSVNLTGAFICAKQCESELRKNKGSIINICSTRAFQSEAGTEAYSASKGGIYALTHALAVSLGPDVRVNSISPGWIDVSAVRKASKAKKEVLSESDHLQHPAGRVGQPEDTAAMILFLSDPRNGFITGQNFIVDGGMTAKMIYV